MPGPPGLLFHYVLDGEGILYGPRGDPHPFTRAHLAVVPAGAKHALESVGDIRNQLRIDSPPTGQQVCEIVAGSSEQADIIVGCGIVKVWYGPSLDLFDQLHDVLAVDLSSGPEASFAFQGIMDE